MSSLSKFSLMTTIFILAVYFTSPAHLTSIPNESNTENDSSTLEHRSGDKQSEKDFHDEAELAAYEENHHLNAREIAMADDSTSLHHDQEPVHDQSNHEIEAPQIALAQDNQHSTANDTNTNTHHEQNITKEDSHPSNSQSTNEMVHINDPGVYMLVFRVADDGSSKQIVFRKMNNSSEIAQAEIHPPLQPQHTDPVVVSHDPAPIIVPHHEPVFIAQESFPAVSNEDIIVEAPAQEVRSSRWGAGNFNLYVSHIEGRGIGYCEGYTSLGLAIFPPFFCSCSFQPFLDLRGHVFDNGKYAANLGGGVRYAIPSRSAVVGVNAYYDYRQVRKGNFDQVGVGFEYLSRCVDLRVNGYIPVGNREGDVRRHFFNDFIGDFHAECRNIEVSAGGFDLEVGTWINNWLPCNWCLPCIYVAAGPYYYQPKCGCSYTGGQFRAEMTFCSSWIIDLYTTYDRHNCGIVQGRITYSIPLDRIFCRSCCDTDCCDWMMRQPVQRHEIIPTQRSCDWTWNWDAPSTSECR